MTRGEGILIYETLSGKLMADCTIEFNGLMAPEDHGYELCRILQSCTPDQLESEVQDFNNNYYQYDDEYLTYTIPYSENMFNEHSLFADYQYVCSKTRQPVKIKAPWNERGEYEIKPDEVYGFFFGELELIKK